MTELARQLNAACPGDHATLTGDFGTIEISRDQSGTFFTSGYLSMPVAGWVGADGEPVQSLNEGALLFALEWAIKVQRSGRGVATVDGFDGDELAAALNEETS
jgi:hypothetical protein